jgi:glycine/D-amino acid oxidase-like deaminating enzyme
MADAFDIVICGAGIAGIAAAYHLAVKHGAGRVLLADERAPLSLTSDKSTECYRNFWPGPDDAMVRLMNRSIDLLEDLARESGNVFRMSRRGYVYATADPARAEVLAAQAARAAAQGAGPLREGDPMPVAAAAPGDLGFEGQPDGADLIRDPEVIRTRFPYLGPRTVAALHVRRAGWLSGQELGTVLLERARARGVRLVRDRVESVAVAGGRVRGVQLAAGGAVDTAVFVNAAGPFAAPVARYLDLELPVFSERHAKLAFTDHRGVIPRAAPLLIWTDPQTLDWSDEERLALAESAATRWLLERFPAGVHVRPEGAAGSPIVLMLWAYDAKPVPETWPLPLDPAFPDVVLRGLTAMLPGLQVYCGRAPRPVVDGGYYTKTRENRPLIGPLPVAGAFVIGALSGFGLMAACAAGELLAAHVTGSALPAYALAFALSRYADPAYRARLATWDSTGQL